jgi:hypothetical protein
VVFSASFLPIRSAIVETLGLQSSSENVVSDLLIISCVEIDSLNFTNSDWWDESHLIPLSETFTKLVSLPFPFASESAVISSNVESSSIGLIAGIISGIVFLIFGIIGGYFLMKRLRLNRSGRAISDSGLDTHDIEFMNSTLTETLVPFNDSVTIEGVPADVITSRGPFILDDSSIGKVTNLS